MISFSAITKREQKPLKNQIKPEAVTFGCRLMAFMPSSNITFEDDTFQRQMLIGAKDSLKSLSKRKDTFQDGYIRPLNQETLAEFYFREKRADSKPGHPDGWGICSYAEGHNEPLCLKRPYPAYNDKFFDAYAIRAIQSNPSLLMAHVRKAAFNNISQFNCHPFTYKNWSFMHNGNASGVTTPLLKDKIKNQYCKALGIELKGNTHSEKAFYYFLGKLNEKFQTVDTTNIPKIDVVKTFAESIKDIIDFSDHKVNSLNGKYLGVKGFIETGPACTFVASDGKMIMAYRQNRNLYLGQKQFKDNQIEYILSSEPIQPEQSKYEIQWLEIPENHLIVLSKNTEGKIIPELYPINNLIAYPGVYNYIGSHKEN